MDNNEIMEEENNFIIPIDDGEKASINGKEQSL